MDIKEKLKQYEEQFVAVVDQIKTLDQQKQQLTQVGLEMQGAIKALKEICSQEPSPVS